MEAPFELATCGWVLGPLGDRSYSCNPFQLQPMVIQKLFFIKLVNKSKGWFPFQRCQTRTFGYCASERCCYVLYYATSRPRPYGCLIPVLNSNSRKSRFPKMLEKLWKTICDLVSATTFVNCSIFLLERLTRPTRRSIITRSGSFRGWKRIRNSTGCVPMSGHSV